MAHQFVAMVDLQELDQRLPLEGQMVGFSDPNRTDRMIKEISQRWPNNTICVYSLSSLQKLKTVPTYARYKVNQDTGEITPV